jgi:hypothetical protein
MGVVLTRRTCPPVLLSPAEIVESAQPNSLYGVRLRLDRNHMTSITYQRCQTQRIDSLIGPPVNAGVTRIN